MSSVPLLSANLVIAVLESFLYAIYLVLASFTLYLVVARHRERANKIPVFWRLLSPLLLGTLALFVAVTAVRLFLVQLSLIG
jgi:hypothetical protein